MVVRDPREDFDPVEVRPPIRRDRDDDRMRSVLRRGTIKRSRQGDAVAKRDAHLVVDPHLFRQRALHDVVLNTFPEMRITHQASSPSPNTGPLDGAWIVAPSARVGLLSLRAG